MLPAVIMIMALSACTTSSGTVSDPGTGWVDDITEAESEGVMVASGSAEADDIYEAMESAITEARGVLRDQVLSAVDEILTLYGEKAGNRVNTSLVEDFRAYAEGYVPSWISGAVEKGRVTDPETGAVHILLSLETDRLVNEIRLFTENLLDKTVEHRDARTHASINLMAAIDEWAGKTR